MERILTILSFYKSLFIWSFLVNIIFTIINAPIISALIVKLFLVILVRNFFIESKPMELLFYKSFRFTSFKLTSIIFIIDSIITVIFLTLMKEFI